MSDDEKKLTIQRDDDGNAYIEKDIKIDLPFGLPDLEWTEKIPQESCFPISDGLSAVKAFQKHTGIGEAAQICTENFSTNGILASLDQNDIDAPTTTPKKDDKGEGREIV